jgi:uncharacterized protein
LKHNQKYIIPFKGLNDGNHIFSFKLDRHFFDLYEVKEINNVELNAEIQLVKKINYLELEFCITGYIEVICDVCLDFYAQKIESSGKLYIRFGEESAELSDELIAIPFNQTEIEISQYLFDFSMLGIPVRKQHTPEINGENGCDPEMIRILRSIEMKEENRKYDPRWNNLKKIKY